jgi:ADP-heptose:LPS heptosyltransferase
LENTCNQLLEYCLAGRQWPEDLLDRALAVNSGRALLSIVIERLGDLFDREMCDVYVRLFSQVIQRLLPDSDAAQIQKRYWSIRRTGTPPARVDRVYVLSRVTLGADVAVTSVILDGLKRCYPDAQILLVGPRKSYELFEADQRIRHFPAPYAQSGSLAEKLRASAALRSQLINGVVVDPDSRLSQLGLIPVCADRDYFFFESRTFGGTSNERLPVLAARWMRDVFGVADAAPYVAPLPASGEPPEITVSLGVGENASKRVNDKFEAELLRMLAETGASVLVDKGGSAEERERVERAVSVCAAPHVRTHDGSFARFAAEIARSRMYAGYDSAGGHVASASSVPLLSIFNGFASERTLERWKPQGTILRADKPDLLDPDLLDEVRRAITYTFHR